MAVAEVHVLGADVLGAAIPVVVRVVGVARDQALEHVCEVLQEPALELVDAHATGRVRRVDAGDPVDDAALADDLDHFLGDVADRQSAAGSKLRLLLEDLHLALTLLRLSAAADVPGLVSEIVFGLSLYSVSRTLTVLITAPPEDAEVSVEAAVEAELLVPPEPPQPPETAATTTTTAPSREIRCVLMSRDTRLLVVRFSALGSAS